MQRRPGPLERRRMRRTQTTGGPTPKLKRYRVPMKDRLFAAMHRQRVPRGRRPRLLERLRARRASPISKAPARPVFRSRKEQIMAGVVAGLVGFTGLAWYASRLPAPVGQAHELVLPVPSPGETPNPVSPSPGNTRRPSPSPDPGPQNSPLG